MGIAICKVLPEDAREYTACYIACWQSAYRGMIPDEYLDNMSAELEQRTEKCREVLTDPGDHEFYCAEYEGRMIGRLVFGRSRDEDKPGAGEIAAIYLIKEFWDKGYGGELLDFALETLKDKGFNEVLLWVLEANGRARRFYEKHHFVFDGAKKEMELGKPLTTVRYLLKPQ